mmetsp:Transcript_70080/g.150046  ORF Transcript_70080/g.150046 Transcript_70080/m.150046 type:complete len:237 (-) Transcript_70080:439-1149(-)
MADQLRTADQADVVHGIVGRGLHLQRPKLHLEIWRTESDELCSEEGGHITWRKRVAIRLLSLAWLRAIECLVDSDREHEDLGVAKMGPHLLQHVLYTLVVDPEAVPGKDSCLDTAHELSEGLAVRVTPVLLTQLRKLLLEIRIGKTGQELLLQARSPRPGEVPTKDVRLRVRAARPLALGLEQVRLPPRHFELEVDGLNHGGDRRVTHEGLERTPHPLDASWVAAEAMAGHHLRLD